MYCQKAKTIIEDIEQGLLSEIRRYACGDEIDSESWCKAFKRNSELRPGLSVASDMCDKHLPIRRNDVGDEVWQVILNGLKEYCCISIGDKCDSDHDYHMKLCESAGCSGCSDYGNNGCGSRIICGIEFDGCDEDETIVSINNNSYCAKQAAEEEKQKEYQELLTIRKQAEDGVHVFSAAIQEALKLMPERHSGDCYGDIVRAAAAVACSQGKNHA